MAKALKAAETGKNIGTAFEGAAASSAASASSGRGIKGISLWLAGTLLFAFTSVVQVPTVQAHNAPEPPSTEDLAKLDKYPNAASLRIAQGPQGITGLHELAESGALGMLKPEIIQQLTPADLEITDGSGRRVVDQFMMSNTVRFADKGVKELLLKYSEGLDAEGQLGLAVLASDYKVLDHVSLSKIGPEHLVAARSVNIPTDEMGGTRKVETNLLLDSIRNRQFDSRLQQIAKGLTADQKAQAASMRDEYGGTIGHYLAQDGNAGRLNDWRDYIQWDARDVSQVTPLQSLVSHPNLFTQVFQPVSPAQGDEELLAIISKPESRKALEQLVLTNEILKQSDAVVQSAITPELLLGATGDDRLPAVAKLKPDQLVEYFNPRVMGKWAASDVEKVWNAVSPKDKYNQSVRAAYYSVMAKALQGRASTAAPGAPSIALK